MRKILNIFIVGLLITLAFGIVGCSSQEAESKASAKAESAGVEEIDEYLIPDAKGDWGLPTPYSLVTRGPGFIRMSYVFDTLLWKNEEGEMIPALAEEYKYDEENNKYVFKLNEAAKWHDGEKVTAGDVEFTVEYIKEHPIFWLDLSPIESVNVLDENEVELILNKKWAPFYSNIAGCMPILPEHIYKDIKKPGKNMTNDATIGSGPFILEDYNPEKGEYVFKAFEDYYLGKPFVNKVKFFKLNPQMQAKSLVQGQVDAIFTNGDSEKIFKDTGINMINSRGMITKVEFNHNKVPFDNKNFRKALAYIIDSDEIIEVAHRGHAFKAYVGLFNSDSDYFAEGLNQYETDSEKASELLGSLGYKKNGEFYVKNGEVLKIKVLGHDRVKRDVDIIVEQLNRQGIKAEAVYKDLQTADSMLNNWEFDISVVESGGMGDPIFLNRDILGKAFTSDRYYKSEEMIKLLKAQLNTSDKQERSEILKKFQKVYSEELPAYPIYYSKFVFAYNDKVDLFFTKEGVSMGIPLALNKMIFIK